MNYNDDEIIRDAFSEKIEAPAEYQQKLKETLKQAHIVASQNKHFSMDQHFQTDSNIENFFKKHKISAKTCLPLSGGICACLGFIIVLSILGRQNSLGKDLKQTQKQYTKLSATPAVTEDAVVTGHTLRTDTPVVAEAPQKTNLPPENTNPSLTTNSTHIPKKEQKNSTEATQTKATPDSDNNTTNHHQGNTTAKPKKSTGTHSPEVVQVQSSYIPEITEGPKRTITPSNSNNPKLTSSPKVSATPDSNIMFPATMETPTRIPVQASAAPTT